MSEDVFRNSVFIIIPLIIGAQKGNKEWENICLCLGIRTH